MGTQQPPAGRLAARVTGATVLVGLLLLVGVTSVSAVTAWRLTNARIEVREHAALHIVASAADSRFATAGRVSDRLVGVLASAKDERSARSALAGIYAADRDLIECVVVLDDTGAVRFEIEDHDAASHYRPSLFTRVQQSGPGVYRDRSGPGAQDRLWLARVVVEPDGTPGVLLVDLGTDVLENIVTEARSAADAYAVAVVSGSSVIASTDRFAGTDLTTGVWSREDAGLGTVDLRGADGERLLGRYSTLSPITDEAWRVVVVSPARTREMQTLRAVAPSVLVLVLGGTLALAMATFISRRIVDPLRSLEFAALRAATGSYVKPVPLSSDDEVGRVAYAFNAVALRLNALHDLSQLLASSSNLDQVLDGILSSMGHIVGPGVAAIYLLDESGRWIVPVRARGADVGFAAAVDVGSDGWLTRAVRGTEPVTFTGESTDVSAELPGLVEESASVLMAPLTAGHETLGVVVVLREPGAENTEAEIEMVRTFSAQAAVAVQNSRLFAVERESRRVAEALRSVAENVVRPEGLDRALSSVEAIVRGLFDAPAAVFVPVDRPALGLPAAEDPVLEGHLLAIANRVMASAAARGTRIVRRGEGLDSDSVLDQLGGVELLVVPVAFDTEHGAVLVIATGADGAATRDIELADAVANEVALAFDNAYFYGRAVARAENLEKIFHISQALGSSLNLNVVLNRVLDVVQPIMSADAIVLMTYDERRKRIGTAMARGDVSPSMVDVSLRPGEDLPGYVFASGSPVALRDLDEGMEGLVGEAAARGLRSLLAVPLRARGRSIGVLLVFSAKGAAYTDEEFNLLQTFAAQAALAIDTARVYGREHEVASVLQASILPGELPDHPELESASHYEPAAGDAEIGGDYYDIVRGADGALWLSIADVCGKGVVAATKTSAIKYSVRAFIAAGLSPDAVVGELNRMIAESGAPSDIVTLWLGRIDPATDLLTWADGGHPPALLVRRNGTVEPLPTTGPLLGAASGVTYELGSTRIRRGDRIVLYTDGVTEARQGNSFFGESRLVSAVAPQGTAAETVREIISAVRRFAHGRLRDDIAVLAITYRGATSAGVTTERSVG